MRYVPYIKDEKVKMQRFISGLPQSWDKIEFDEPKTLEYIIRKERYCYEQFKSKTKPREEWKKKTNSKFKKKEFKSSRFKIPGKSSRMGLPTISVYQQNFPSRSVNKPFRATPSKIDNTKRETLKCWGCGEEHLMRDCLHR
jgi:hypothetical protein